MNRKMTAVVVGLLMSGLAGPAWAAELARYKMDEADTITSLVDSIAGYNAPVSKGQPMSVTAPSTRRGVTFDGDDNAKAPASSTDLQLTGDYTWAFWAKAGAPQYYGTFFCKAGVTSNPPTHWSVGAGGTGHGGKIYADHGANGAWDTGISPTAIQGAWHHIAITRSGTTQTSYVDGVLKATGTLAGNPIGGGVNQTFNIGWARKVGSNVNYVGDMDDLRIWDNALSAAEVEALFMDGVVSPGDTTVTAGYGGGDPSPVTYTVTNYDTISRNYVVAEVDAGGNLNDYTWLSLTTTGLTVGAGGTGTLDAVISSGSLPIGTHQAYLKFTDNAARSIIRRIELRVVACEWEVTPSTDTNAILNPVAYMIRNLGGQSITYTANKTGDCDWLVLDPYTGGPLTTGQTEAVTATINDAGLADGFHTCQLVFTNSCTPAQQQTRTVTYAKAVSVDLGYTDIENGLVLYSETPPPDGFTTPDNQGGVDCLRNSEPPLDRYFYFKVDDQYAFNGNNPVQHITIEYYDTGSGELQLQYDSTADRYKDGGSVTLTGDNTWKQHTFVVNDAWFGNRQNDASDFRIFKDADYFYLNVVRVQGKVACESFVSPLGQVAASAIQNYAATPSSTVYTVQNIGALGGLTYTVQETDATGGTPTDYAWLDLGGKTGGGPLASLATDTVTASIVDTSMAPGTYTGYIAFDDSCSSRHVRQIELTIIGCQWQVSPSAATVQYAADPEGSPIAAPVFTITNTGADGLSYVVAKVGTCDWLTITDGAGNPKTGGGPLAYNTTDTVTVTIDPAGLDVGTYTCDVQFTNNCAPADVLTRTVTLVILPDITAGALAHYAMDDLDTIVELVDSVAGHNAGVSRGQPMSTAGMVGTAVSFAGDPNDAAQTARNTTDLQLTGDYTWAFWANADASQQTYAAFFCKADYAASPSNPQTNWVLNAGGSANNPAWAGKVFLEQGPTGATGTWDTGILLTDIAGAWHHIAITRTGTTQKSYLDGVLKATGTLAQSPPGGDQAFHIAFPRVHKSGSNDRYYKGAMDDLRIYDRALSQSAIRKLMPSPCNTPRADLNGDNSVDGADYGLFAGCFNGTGNPMNAGCECADLNDDLSVDGADYGLFAGCFNGTGNPSPCGT